MQFSLLSFSLCFSTKIVIRFYFKVPHKKILLLQDLVIGSDVLSVSVEPSVHFLTSFIDIFL